MPYFRCHYIEDSAGENNRISVFVMLLCIYVRFGIVSVPCWEANSIIFTLLTSSVRKLIAFKGGQ